MNVTGWIKVHRKVMNHWLWGRKPFDEFHAWTHLLMLAAHNETNFEYRGSIYPLKRGEFYVSQQQLGREWDWNIKKVRRFIKALVDDAMITTDSGQVLTKITVCNYEYYQLDGQGEGNTTGKVTGNNEGKAEGLVTGSQNKNIKNIKNINNLKENKKTRAREKFFSYFCERIISGGDLTAVWNELNLKHLEVLDDDCLSVMFEAYLNRLHKEFPNLPSVDEVSSQEWGKAFNAILYPDIDPHHWAGHYLCHGFAEYIIDYHRGMNLGQWVADIAYAFKPETMSKVYRQTGVY
ncbi:hypothetical protein VoSk93_05660 [Vibrio owensii]